MLNPERTLNRFYCFCSYSKEVLHSAPADLGSGAARSQTVRRQAAARAQSAAQNPSTDPARALSHGNGSSRRLMWLPAGEGTAPLNPAAAPRTAAPPKLAPPHPRPLAAQAGTIRRSHSASSLASVQEVCSQLLTTPRSWQALNSQSVAAVLSCGHEAHS